MCYLRYAINILFPTILVEKSQRHGFCLLHCSYIPLSLYILLLKHDTYIHIRFLNETDYIYYLHIVYVYKYCACIRVRMVDMIADCAHNNVPRTFPYYHFPNRESEWHACGFQLLLHCHRFLTDIYTSETSIVRLHRIWNLDAMNWTENLFFTL